MRILIAEDDLTSRNILAAVLKKKGHDVVETTDGMEAWDALQKPDTPKLAILDWMMPKMDGLEVVRRVRAIQSSRPPYIIMLTSMDKKPDVVVGLDAGADDYLTKPFDLGELTARVGVGHRIVKMQERLTIQIQELRQAMEHIKTLQDILPICSFCKKIRDDQGYWERVDMYISKHSDTQFSHSVCPECKKKHYPELCQESSDEIRKKR